MMGGARADAVLLASGGLDSTTLAYWLEDKGIPFLPLFIDYGQHAASTELSTLSEVLPAGCLGNLEKVDVSDVYRGSGSRLIDEPNLWEDDVEADDFYLPYRNLLLLTLGAAFAQSRGIPCLYTAFINSNHAKEIDCSARFFDQLEGMLADYGTVKVMMPFRDMPKAAVAKIGLELGAPIARTFSCHAASVVPCGACPNCVDRLGALEALI